MPKLQEPEITIMLKSLHWFLPEFSDHIQNEAL